MDEARPLLKQVKEGTLSVEEFEQRIALPGTKEARKALDTATSVDHPE